MLKGVGKIPSLNMLLPGDGAEQWPKPATNTIKIDVDATIFEEERRHGFALMVRDSSRDLMVARSKCVYGLVEPMVGEAKGIIEDIFMGSSGN